MSNLNDLNTQIKKIHKKFVNLISDQFYFCIHCNPNDVEYYNEMAMLYSDGAEACVNYFETLNILELVKDLNRCGFFKEVFSLRNFIEDSIVLEHIKKAEQELLDLEHQ